MELVSHRTALVLVPIALHLAASSAAHAQHIWTGGANDNEWCTPNNWNPASVPFGSSFIPAEVTTRISLAGNCTPTFNSLLAMGPIFFDGDIRNSGAIEASDIIISISGNFAAGPSTPGAASLTFVNSAEWRIGMLQNQLVLVQNGALLRIEPVGTHRLSGAILRNNGAVRAASGVSLLNGSAIENEGTWTIASSGTHITRVGSLGQFVNSGTLTTDFPSSVAIIAVPIANSGLIQVNSGNLDLGPGTHTNSQISVSAGRRVNFTGTPTSTFVSANHLSGDGTAIVTNGLMVADGGSMLLELDPSGTHGGGFVLDNSGGLFIASSAQVVNAGSFNWEDGGIFALPAAELRNQGRFVVRAHSETLTDLTLRNQGLLVIDLPSSQTFLSNSSIINEAGSTMEWRAGTIRPISGSDPLLTLINHYGLLAKVTTEAASIVVPIELHTGSRLEVREGTLDLDDQGTRSLNSGAIAVNLHATGTLRGTLRCDQGRFEGAGDFRILGPTGTLIVDGAAGATNVMNGTDDAFHLSGGRIDGNGRFSNSGKVVTSAGTIGPASGNAGNVVLDNTGFLHIRDSTLRLAGAIGNAPQGTIAIDGSINMVPGSSIANHGDVTIAQLVAITPLAGSLPTLFHNDVGGHLRKIETGPSSISVPLDNDGEIRVQQGALNITGPISQLTGSPGSFELNGGNWIIEVGAVLSFNNRPFRKVGGNVDIRYSGNFPDYAPNLIEDEAYTEFGAAIDPEGEMIVRNQAQVVLEPGGIIDFNPFNPFGFLLEGDSSLSGVGEVRRPVTVNDNSRIAPGRSPGTLIVGPLTMNGGILDIELAGYVPGAEHDQLAVTGPAALGGVLRVSLFGGFNPTVGDSFTILTAQGPITGAFTSVEPAGIYTVQYNAGSVVITVANQSCPADFNADGFVDPDDLSDFITCFFLDVQFPGVCPGADFNADGFRDPDDLADFITTFFTSAC